MEKPKMKQLKATNTGKQYYLYVFMNTPDDNDTPETFKSEIVHIGVSKLGDLETFYKNFQKNIHDGANIRLTDETKTKISRAIFLLKKFKLDTIQKHGPFPTLQAALMKKQELTGKAPLVNCSRMTQIRIDQLVEYLDTNMFAISKTNKELAETLGWSLYLLKKTVSMARKCGKLLSHVEFVKENNIIAKRTLITPVLAKKLELFGAALDKATKKSEEQSESNVVEIGTARQVNSGNS